MADATPLDGVMTFTGETLMGALTALDSALPKGAYKSVSLGGRTFTDISPAYSLEVISEHFGPLGLGWGYTIEDEHTHDHKTADKPQQDGTVRHGQHYLGVTLRIRLWYAYIAPNTEQFTKTTTLTNRVEWQSYGGNANAGSGADEHFSWQGALTNAIGKGWSMQGFQRRIYKGEDFTLDEKREADASAAPAAPVGADTKKTPQPTSDIHAVPDPLVENYKQLMSLAAFQDKLPDVKKKLGDPADTNAAFAAYKKLSPAKRKDLESLVGVTDE